MKILNNSIVDTVIEYASVKFGVELSADAVSDMLKQLSYSNTLNLVDSINDEDDDVFTDFIDLSAVNEAYGGIGTHGGQSVANVRKQNTTSVQTNRRADNLNDKDRRAGTGATRTVAGGNKQPTSANAKRSAGPDPDDQQRQANSQTAGTAANQAAANAQEIERLKQLAQGRR